MFLHNELSLAPVIEYDRKKSPLKVYSVILESAKRKLHGNRSRCAYTTGCPRRDKPTGRTPYGSPWSRPATPGLHRVSYSPDSSLGWNCNNPRRTSLGTIPRRCRACRRGRTCSPASGLPDASGFRNCSSTTRSHPGYYLNRRNNNGRCFPRGRHTPTALRSAR